MQAQDLGALAPLVAYAGNLAAAALSLRMIAFGRAINDPKVDMAPMLTRVAGVAIIVGVALFFASTRNHKPFPIGAWAIGLGITLGIGFIADIGLRTWLTVKCTNPTHSAIGGFVMTQNAKAILAGTSTLTVPGVAPPTSKSQLYCLGGRVPEKVWEDWSIALAHMTIAFVFVFWVGAGALAVAYASLVFERALAP